MIRAMRIRNFQSHKDTVLKFDKGFNVIVGENDVGKTAIIRALRWLLFNDLKGDYFRSRWGGDTIVSIVLDDKTVIKRVRTNSENYYELNGQKLKGFGTGVPKEIQDVLRMNNINFQSQFDNVFLFSLSGSKMTEYFNTVFNLQSVNQIQQALNSSKRDVRANIRFLEDKKKKIESKIADLAWLDKAKTYVDKYKKIQEKISDLDAKISTVESEFYDLKQLPKPIDFSKVQGYLHKYEKIQRKISEIQENRNKVLKVFSEIDSIDFNLKSNRDSIKKLEQELHSFIGETCPFCGRPIDETVINQ